MYDGIPSDSKVVLHMYMFSVVSSDLCSTSCMNSPRSRSHMSSVQDLPQNAWILLRRSITPLRSKLLDLCICLVTKGQLEPCLRIVSLHARHCSCVSTLHWSYEHIGHIPNGLLDNCVACDQVLRNSSILCHTQPSSQLD